MAATPIALRAPRGARSRSVEVAFRAFAGLAAGALLVALAYMLVRMGQVSAPAWRQKSGELLTGTTWEPSSGHFGGLPFVYGTLVTSVVAIILAVPVALGTALFVTELASRKLRATVAPFIDLLAAVPSVVYGLWAIIVLVPVLQKVESWLANTVGHVIPIFAGPAPGVSYLTAGVVLAIMILPTISAVSREVFLTVPRDQREAAYALGATKWESIRLAVLPGSRSGIVAAVILGLGRALGETIAVTIVIGNSPTLSKSLLAPGYTMASVIANEFSETTSALHLEALIAIGLLLFAVTLAVNILARVTISGGGERIRLRIARMRRGAS